MNETVRDLWEQLRSRFLFPLERVDRWPQPLPDEDADSFIERLTQASWLTPFQQNEIHAGRLDRLVLGNYRLQRQLEHGPQGKVYFAEHLFLRQAVIIRLLRDGPSLQRRGIATWLSQVDAVARWNHPAIVGVIDVGAVHFGAGSVEKPLPDPEDATSGLYFISPYIEGRDLRQLVWSEGPLPVELACEILYQAARALAEAHARNLSHGSLGPSSILRGADGKVRIVDFGLKIWPHESYRSTRAGQRPESPEPGAIQGDLVGMAQCLYWALVGQTLPSFHDDHLASPMRAFRPDVPAALDDLLEGLIGRRTRQAWSFQRIQEALLPFVRAYAPSPAESVDEGAYPKTVVLPPSSGASTRAILSLLPPEKSGRSVLVVDDESGIRAFCRLALGRYGLHCDEAANGVLALKAFANHAYDLVLLDIDMPEMDGLEVCRRVRLVGNRPHLKIILFSGRVEADEMAPMLLAGADDFLTKPFSPVQLQNRVQAALRLKQAQERTDLLTRDLLLLNREMEKHLHARDSDLVEARNALVLGLAKLAEYRDTDTGLHLNRLQVFARRLAEEGIHHPAFAGQMDRNFIDLLGCCAPLHDIGKVGLPDHVLLKPGKLDEEERLLMQTHTTIGSETLRRIAQEHGFARAFLQMAIDIARHHHERFDGTGYPDRLVGSAIPLSARLVAVCDVYDALRSRRVYKPAIPHTSVVEYVRQGAGSHFDPAVIECFERCQDDFGTIYESLKD